MNEQNGKKGLVVKNRHDEYFIIPDDLLGQFKVAPEKLEQVQALYESDVEGQSLPGLGDGQERWVVGGEEHKVWFASLD